MILANASLVSIHLFRSRSQAFKADGVLQENVILHLRRDARQGDVRISTSTDSSFSDTRSITVPFDRVVAAGDATQVIHIPSDERGPALASSTIYQSRLTDLGMQVSTGPVVDFRVRRHLHEQFVPGDAPLLYAAHFSGGALRWPLVNGRKPNGLAISAETTRLLYPRGYYVVVRRFTSKEERRRVVASVVEPDALPEPWIAFENHLNVYHSGKASLGRATAYGLSTYLNSKLIDDWLRNFSGHTQVNATDLRMLPMPTAERLRQLGDWRLVHRTPTEAEIEAELNLVG